jgi:flagellar basal body-associated protein FliL
MRKSFLLSIIVLLALSAPAHGAEARKPPVHKITQSVSFLGLDPIYTTIMDGNRPLGLLMIGIGLDVPDSDLRDRVTQSMPSLRDAYVRTLMSYTATSVRPWRQPDVGEIADRLQHVTDRMLDRQGARILLGQVAIRLTR